MINRFAGRWLGLSNFAFHPDGKTVEHEFQAAKDPKAAPAILAVSTPKEAKALGGPNGIAKLPNDWDSRSRDVMLEALRKKFAIPHFRELLLSTGDDDLVEGNYHHDVIWGRCLCNLHGGQGENRLGLLLMQVRRELRDLDVVESWR